MSSHQKLIEEIERKMAQPSKFKSYEEKRQKLFEYDIDDSEFRERQDHNYQQNKQNSIILREEAEKSLEEIYCFYLNSYIQPRKKYQTFDVVNERRLTFQPFILFMKNFRLLKTIYPLEKIKLLFKKHSNYGKYLTFDNFLFMIHEMSHEPEAKRFFNTLDQETVDVETAEQVDRQELYSYMNLGDAEKYRKNFKPIFQPFNCEQKPQFDRVKYTYRKFSLPELRKKAVPLPKNNEAEKDLFVMKNKEIVNDNPFQKAKSIVVSWESLRSKSVATLQENSTDIVKKKYVKEQPEDDIYLSQYNPKQKAMRAKINQKIKELSEAEKVKNKAILERLSEKEKKRVLKLSK